MKDCRWRNLRIRLSLKHVSIYTTEEVMIPVNHPMLNDISIGDPGATLLGYGGVTPPKDRRPSNYSADLRFSAAYSAVSM